jgi:hypothetical protein
VSDPQTPPAEPTQEPTPTWDNAVLTDRSRIHDGWSWCPRARYLRYHSGPSGYGIQRKALALPLTTGAYTHDLLAELLLAHQEEARGGEKVQAKTIIEKQVGKYKTICAKRGFQEGLAEDTDRVIQEQAALIEGFGWCAHYYWIPQLFEEWEPVMVEEEITAELAGAAPPAEGEPRIILMLRPDLVLRRRLDGSLAEVDFKTAADTSYISWRRQWEDNGQLALQGWGAGEALGEPVDFAYVYALIKGRRTKDKGENPIERQRSPLVYAYHRAANPPMVEEDWKLRYEWVDPETGETRRVGKGYQLKSIQSHLFPGKPAGMSTTEYWVRALALEDAGAQREILGPYQILPEQKQAMLRAAVAEEQRWREKLWRIYDAGEKAGWDERDPGFQQVLDQEAPRTWDCHRYGKDCQFLSLCRKEGGWEAPLEGGFVLRRPHHQPELEQMKGRGIEPPEVEDEDQDDA